MQKEDYLKPLKFFMNWRGYEIHQNKNGVYESKSCKTEDEQSRFKEEANSGINVMKEIYNTCKNSCGIVFNNVNTRGIQGIKRINGKSFFKRLYVTEYGKGYIIAIFVVESTKHPG